MGKLSEEHPMLEGDCKLPKLEGAPPQHIHI